MQQAKIEKLKKLLEVANDGLSKADFVENFKKVIQQVLNIEKQVIEKINNAIGEMKDTNNASLQATQGDLRALGVKLEVLIAKALKEQENGLNFIRDKVRKIKEGKDGVDGKDGIGRDGQDGKDADESKIIQEVLNKIKLPEIDKSELEIIKKEMETFREQRTRFGGGGFSKIAMDGHILDPYTPTGSINGVNKDFVLTNTPNPATSLKVFLNGMKMKLTTDYTITGRTLTLNTAPATGESLEVEHRK